MRVKPTVQADHRGAVWWVVFLWASADLVEDTVGASWVFSRVSRVVVASRVRSVSARWTEEKKKYDFVVVARGVPRLAELRIHHRCCLSCVA